MLPVVGDIRTLDDLQQALRQRSSHLIHEDVDLAAAGEPDAEGEIVRDAVGEQTGLASSENLPRCFDDLAFHAAARNGPRQLAALRDDQLGPDWSRCRSSRCDNARKRDSFVTLSPPFELGENLPHGPNRSPALSAWN